jgi:hypothetical protein
VDAALLPAAVPLSHARPGPFFGIGLQPVPDFNVFFFIFRNKLFFFDKITQRLRRLFFAGPAPHAADDPYGDRNHHQNGDDIREDEI